MNLLLQLFLAHIIGDFFLQGNRWIKDKETKKWRSKYLYLHVLIHFALVVIITGLFKQEGGVALSNIFHFWLPALLIACLHLLIDGAKLSFQKEKTRRVWFFIDQVLHLLTIVLIVVFRDRSIDFSVLMDTRALVLGTAILVLLKPTSLLIKTVISKWPSSFINDTANSEETNAPIISTSLENAGELIGVLERMMIILFILLGKWEGVGFLLAAKSVFRFGDLKEARNMKLTEYVLIGTLLSFGIAILTGVITLKLWERY